MTFLFLELRGTTVSLYSIATGSPRPKVEWSMYQISTLSSPFFQEDGCLAVNTTKAHGEEDYIRRATNSFGLSETTTTVIATKLTGIKTIITLSTFQLYIQNTFLPHIVYDKLDRKMFDKNAKHILLLLIKNSSCVQMCLFSLTSKFLKFYVPPLDSSCDLIQRGPSRKADGMYYLRAGNTQVPFPVSVNRSKMYYIFFL